MRPTPGRTSQGNAEGPVNSDFNFGDSGRTEAFDDPWVNLNGYGYLPNDRRHSFKVRGQYAISEHWQIGATFLARSPGVRSAPSASATRSTTATSTASTICVANCTATDSTQRVFVLVAARFRRSHAVDLRSSAPA